TGGTTTTCANAPGMRSTPPGCPDPDLGVGAHPSPAGAAAARYLTKILAKSPGRWLMPLQVLSARSGTGPLGQGWSGLSDQNESQPTPRARANPTSRVASSGRNVSETTLLTPIIGVIAIIAQARASEVPGQTSWIRVLVEEAAVIARSAIPAGAVP